MLRGFFVALAASAVVWGIGGSVAAAASPLIPETTLLESGLTRPWFAQVELDRRRAAVAHVALCDGALFITTNSAVVHAIDAETGRTLWSQRVGKPGHPTTSVDARGGRVAVVNGSRLYVLDRTSGDLLEERETIGVPGAGPALSRKHAFVPTVTGMLVAYRLPPLLDSAAKPKAGQDEAADLEATPPLLCQSDGRALVQPLVTREHLGAEYVVWTTDRGYLYFGRIEREANDVLTLKYRLKAGGTIVARPAYLPPSPEVLGDTGVVFVTSTDGFVYAIQEEDGASRWRFSVGEPILQSPAVTDDHVFVTTERGRMYCLSLKTGKPDWSVGNVAQFVAAGKKRVYVVDRVGHLVALDLESGAKLASLPFDNSQFRLLNSDTDRIYLVSRGGLVQCLREIEQVEPLIHGRVRKEAARAESQPTSEGATSSEKPAHQPASPKAE